MYFILARLVSNVKHELIRAGVNNNLLLIFNFIIMRI